MQFTMLEVGGDVMLVGFVACKQVLCEHGAKSARVLRVVCDCIWITPQPVHVSPLPMISHLLLVTHFYFLTWATAK